MNKPAVSFPLGNLYATKRTVEQIPNEEIIIALGRHASGDWGDICTEDREENELSLREGFRLMSVYEAKDGTKFWIITEADRSCTTVLLPEDY